MFSHKKSEDRKKYLIGAVVGALIAWLVLWASLGGDLSSGEGKLKISPISPIKVIQWNK